MGQRNLLSVSIALCAVVVGADRASAGSVNVPTNIPKVSVPTNIPKVSVPTNIPKVSVPTNLPKVNVQTNLAKVNAALAAQWVTPKPVAARPAGAGTPAPNNAPAQRPLSTAGASSSGSGAAGGGSSSGSGAARYYSAASYNSKYNSKTACGRYPYPPC